MVIWTWTLATRMAELCEDHLTLMELAVIKVELDERYWEIDESPVEIAEVLSAASEEYGLVIPSTDVSMLAWLRRRGIEQTVIEAPVGAILTLPEGGLAYRLAGGVMEPYDDGFAIVQFSPDRYDTAWLIPGVAYLHEVKQ